MPQLTNEQSAIINDLLGGNNTQVNAVPGSGKTSTVLSLAEQVGSIIMITYNAHLKSEVRRSAPRHLRVENYHSLCHHLFGRGKDDRDITEVLRRDEEPAERCDYQYLVVDEAHDMTHLYYTLLCKFMGHMEHTPIMCVMGDTEQCIYQFKDADPVFLSMAPEYFGNGLPWVEHAMTRSFRLRANVVGNINRRFGTTITAHRGGGGVNTVNVKAFRRPDVPRRVIQCIRRHARRYEDVYILMNSLNSTNVRDLSRMITNALTDSGISVFVPEDNIMDADYRGKITVTTMHKSKGTERPVVIVITKLDKHGHPICLERSVEYVAKTRATEHLECINYLTGIEADSNWQPPLVPSRLGSYLSQTTAEWAVGMLGVSTVRAPGPQLHVHQCWRGEDVSAITGIAMGLTLRRRHGQLATEILRLCREVHVSDALRAPEKQELIDTLHGSFDNPQPLRLAAISHMVSTNYKYKYRQIQSFDWVDEQTMWQMCDHLSLNNPQFEVPVAGGYVDVVDGHCAYEIKCVGELRDEHRIQLAAYAHLLGHKYQYYLVNMTNGHTETIDTTHADEVVQKLMGGNA